MDTNAKEEDGFSVDRVTVNILVTVMIGLKEVMEKTLRAVERTEKKLSDITCEMSKMADAMYRLRKDTEDKEKEDSGREEMRQNWERRQEEERRKEREEERKREERKQEEERRERGEKRRQRAWERREKENNPRVKSVLGRTYTQNTIKDTTKKQ